MVTFGSGRPAYAQVAEAIRNRIISGELQPGDRVPSGRDIETQYQVSREVARRALSLLQAEGWTVGHVGKGTLVRARPDQIRRSSVWNARPERGMPTSPTTRSIEAAGKRASWEHRSERTKADETLAERLGIEVGDPVMRTENVVRADGEPVQLSTSWEPLAVTRGSTVEWPDDSEAVGVVTRFDLLGIRVDSVEEEVSARMPTETEREILRIGVSVPVMEIRRTYRAGEQAVETADIVVSADRYVLHYGMPVL